MIEHLQYPSDLRFGKIEEFISNLSLKIQQTMKTYNENPTEYSTFLKNFGKFVTPKIEETQVPIDKYVIEELHNITNKLNRLESLNLTNRINRTSSSDFLKRNQIDGFIDFKNVELIKKT